MYYKNKQSHWSKQLLTKTALLLLGVVLFINCEKNKDNSTGGGAALNPEKVPPIADDKGEPNPSPAQEAYQILKNTVEKAKKNRWMGRHGVCKRRTSSTEQSII